MEHGGKRISQYKLDAIVRKNEYEINRGKPIHSSLIYALVAIDRVVWDNAFMKRGHCVKLSGFATPGGDPVWGCSECGKGVHVYGIEASIYGADVADHQWVSCPNCGADMRERSEDGEV